MKKVLLSTYLVKIKDRQWHYQYLNRFNLSRDFLDVLSEYLDSLLNSNIQEQLDSEQSSIHLTLTKKPTIDRKNRCIYGYFSSGVSGEEYPIKKIDSKKTVFEVKKDEAPFKDLFFYFYIPKETENGYLILQKKRNYGVKTILDKTINQYLAQQENNDYRVLINNLVQGAVFEKMITEGNLKKIEFIKKKLPSSIEELFSNPNKIISEKGGTIKTSISSSSGSGLGSIFKNFIYNYYKNKIEPTAKLEIEGVEDEFDEIEFELELDKKKKTFYVSNRNRIQPDLDVSKLLEYDSNGIPTTESLIREAKILIEEIKL